MADEANGQDGGEGTQDGQGADESITTLDEALARIAERDESIRRLEKSNTIAVNDLRKVREDLKTTKRTSVDAPTLAEIQERAETAERERDAEREGRRNDRVNAALERAASKFQVPTESIDLVPLAIDRDLIDIGDDGTIRGVEEAIAKLQKARPVAFGAPKKPVGGTGSVRQPGSTGNQQQQVSDLFSGLTSLGT